MPMTPASRLGSVCSIVLLSLWSSLAAQEPELTGVVEKTDAVVFKIAVPEPRAAATAQDAAQTIVEVLRDDLDYSGYFDIVDPTLYSLVPASADSSTVRFEDWISIGADHLAKLQVGVDGDRIDLQAWLYDNESGTMTFARRYGGRLDLVRRVAHNVADDLVQHFTGRPGVAMTRIAFVSEYGEGKEIYLMDYDGARVRRLTTTGTLNLSPAWSPDGSELTDVSWRGRQPGVYVMSSEGKLGHLKTIGGDLSSAPDWSPDGRRLAYSSDFHGNTEIYLLNRDTGRNSRLTRNPAIDTAPAFAPNGREIAFTSDRSGTPQIYLMDAEGLNVRRITWAGSYNESAAWSPSGDKLAYVSRIEGRFQIVVLDLTTDERTRLTRGRGNKENPRWSRDGRHIVFASDLSGSWQIYTMRNDGIRVRRLTRGGSSVTPDWSR
jgi:TolB protein